MSYDCDIMSSTFLKEANVTKSSVFHFKVGTIKDHIYFSCTTIQFSSVQSLNHIQLFAAPWTAAHQASLSTTNSRSLLTLMFTESVIPCNHLILCHPLLLLPSIFPSIRVFSMNQFFASGGQRIRVSASASVIPMNIQDRFPLGLTGLISLQSKGLWSIF